MQLKTWALGYPPTTPLWTQLTIDSGSHCPFLFLDIMDGMILGGVTFSRILMRIGRG